MKKILILLFSCSQAFGAYTVPTINGTTSLELQVPYSQGTLTATNTSLLETGNNNLLLNGSFEATSGITSWSAASGSVAADETTNIFAGKKSQLITMTSVNGISLSQDVTPTIQMVGSNFEASVAIKTAATTLQVCARQAAATYGACATVLGDSQWHIYSVNMPGPSSGSIGVSVITTGSTTGTYYVDAGYVGLARNLGNGAPANDFAAHISSAGVVSGENVDFINGNCVVSGTSVYTCTFNTSLFSIAPICTVGSVNVNSIVVNLQVATTTTTVTFFGYNTQNSAATATPFDVNCIRGSTDWVQPTIQAPNWDIPLTSWTPVTSNLGTISGTSCFYSRNNDRLIGDCRFTVGSPGSGTASVTLPLGLTINSSFGTLKCGDATTQAVSAGSGVQVGSVYNVLCTGGSTSISFGFRDQANGGLSSLTGTSGFASLQPISFQFSIPIQGWTTTLNAPLLVGSVTSNASGAERIERAKVSTACTSGTCTITSQSSAWLTSIVWNSTGNYTVTYPSNTWSIAPTCFITVGAASGTVGGTSSYLTSPTTTSFQFISVNTANSIFNNAFDIVCMGPR